MLGAPPTPPRSCPTIVRELARLMRSRRPKPTPTSTASPSSPLPPTPPVHIQRVASTVRSTARPRSSACVTPLRHRHPGRVERRDGHHRDRQHRDSRGLDIPTLPDGKVCGASLTYGDVLDLFGQTITRHDHPRRSTSRPASARLIGADHPKRNIPAAWPRARTAAASDGCREGWKMTRFCAAGAVLGLILAHPQARPRPTPETTPVPSPSSVTSTAPRRCQRMRSI